MRSRRRSRARSTPRHSTARRSTSSRRRPGSTRPRASSTRRRRWRPLPEPIDLGGLELAPRAGLEPLQVEERIANPVQPPHGVADRLEHPLHLVLAALVERELDAAAAEAPRARRRRAAVVELDA